MNDFDVTTTQVEVDAAWLAGFSPLLPDARAVPRCACEPSPHRMLAPCPSHERTAHAAWLDEHAPRFATAQRAGDPICDIEQFPARAAAIVEFRELRIALSPLACEDFDLEWELLADGPWPSPWEFVLTVRDNWPEMVQAQERDTVRRSLSRYLGLEAYPLDAQGAYEIQAPDGFTTAEHLFAEANALAALADRASLVERIIRDHLAGGAGSAAQILAPLD